MTATQHSQICLRENKISILSIKKRERKKEKERNKKKIRRTNNVPDMIWSRDLNHLSTKLKELAN